MAKQFELTLSDVLSDPLILSVAVADGWSNADFRAEMTAAARGLAKSTTRFTTSAARSGHRPAQVADSMRACCA